MLQFKYDTEVPFFQFLNTFEFSSNKKINDRRTMPHSYAYQIKENEDNLNLPVILMSFEDEETLSLAYSIFTFAVSRSNNHATEKNRILTIAKEIFFTFFKFKQLENHTFGVNFELEEVLFDLENQIS